MRDNPAKQPSAVVVAARAARQVPHTVAYKSRDTAADASA
jgi:hypothetical protein